ncbi:aldo/keto reductase, partial [Vibrio mediterranei]|uniref:aldo/keto reductase n=1 Tax=Vibrio mediterranei TaxID=689 RepID=UPI001EFD0BC3
MQDKQSFFIEKSIKYMPSDMPVSKVGIGTYLGTDSLSDSEGYIESIIEAVSLGCNLIDTAINYRGMLSELNVAQAVKLVITRNLATREQLVIASKGGFVPCDWTNKRPLKDLVLQKLDM